MFTDDPNLPLESPPRTPPGFRLVIGSRAPSPMSLGNENWLKSATEPLELSLTAVVPKPSPMRSMIRLDNLPWFKFQDRFWTFLKDQGGMRLNPTVFAVMPFNILYS